MTKTKRLSHEAERFRGTSLFSLCATVSLTVASQTLPESFAVSRLISAIAATGTALLSASQAEQYAQSYNPYRVWIDGLHDIEVEIEATDIQSALEQVRSGDWEDKISLPVSEPVEQLPPAPSVPGLPGQIQQFFFGEGIELSFEEELKGMTIDSVRFRLQHPNQLKKALALSEELSLYLGLEEKIAITRNGGCLSIELPSRNRTFPRFFDYEWQPLSEGCYLAVGVSNSEEVFQIDLADSRYAHLLVGGTTGSGKSEFLRAIIASLISRYSPAQLQLVLIDPKRITFPEFEQIPWLNRPIVKDVNVAIEALTRLVLEMENRYRLLEAKQCPDLASYNAISNQHLSRIVCIFDEYADFMAEKEAKDEIENSIKRLGAMARAAGIHLILATQRPEAGVVTPIIRSNLPGRIALKVASEADSKIVLGGRMTEAASLLGKGDLYLLEGGGLLRLQSLYLGTTKEVNDFIQSLPGAEQITEPQAPSQSDPLIPAEDLSGWLFKFFPSENHELPEVPGLYVAYSDPSNPIYIGEAKNIYLRWNTKKQGYKHHCYDALLKVTEKASIKIGYKPLIGISDSDRKLQERMLINQFSPSWNDKGDEYKTVENTVLLEEEKPVSFDLSKPYKYVSPPPEKEQTLYEKIAQFAVDLEVKNKTCTVREVQRKFKINTAQETLVAMEYVAELELADLIEKDGSYFLKPKQL